MVTVPQVWCRGRVAEEEKGAQGPQKAGQARGLQEGREVVRKGRQTRPQGVYISVLFTMCIFGQVKSPF